MFNSCFEVDLMFRVRVVSISIALVLCVAVNVESMVELQCAGKAEKSWRYHGGNLGQRKHNYDEGGTVARNYGGFP